MSFFIPTTHIKILPPRKAGRHWWWQGESHGGGDKEVRLVALVAGTRKEWRQGGGISGDWDEESGVPVSVVRRRRRAWW